MARKASGPKAPVPVTATEHKDKRVNLPTADAAEDFGGPELEAVRKVSFERDPSLDPQLIWRGKYFEDDPSATGDLAADAPPIYIQEKIVPRVLVENLRNTAAAGEAEPELTLFDTFDGLDELDFVDFYQHQANWSNRMILGDSLQVMASLADREALRGHVQMIYLDPPYGIKFGSNWQVSARKRDVKDGKLEDAAREAEQIKAFRDTWELGIHSYLSYLRDRLLAARELLTESGSCFVQIGDENVHLVRSLMDEVFGSENFVSQITTQKTTAQTSEYLPGASDYVLWYGKAANILKHRQLWRQSRDRTGYRWLKMADGASRGMSAGELAGSVALPHGALIYQADNLTSQRPPGSFPVEFEGRTYGPGRGYWKTGEEGLKRLIAADRIHSAANSLRYVRYANDWS